MTNPPINPITPTSPVNTDTMQNDPMLQEAITESSSLVMPVSSQPQGALGGKIVDIAESQAPKTYKTIMIIGLIGLSILIVLILILIFSNIDNIIPGNKTTPTPTISITNSPVNTSETPTPTQEQTDNLNYYINEDRLKISSPTKNKVISKNDGTLILSGKMKGFFEGLMEYRIKTINGDLIYSGTILAGADNYLDFVDFSQLITIPTNKISNITYGYIEFFEGSMKDGTENIITSIPITFK